VEVRVLGAEAAHPRCGKHRRQKNLFHIHKHIDIILLRKYEILTNEPNIPPRFFGNETPTKIFVTSAHDGKGDFAYLCNITFKQSLATAESV
jgi:hypothetical protein